MGKSTFLIVHWHIRIMLLKQIFYRLVCCNHVDEIVVSAADATGPGICARWRSVRILFWSVVLDGQNPKRQTDAPHTIAQDNIKCFYLQLCAIQFACGGNK